MVRLTELFLVSRRSGLPYLPTIHTDAETYAWMQKTVLCDAEVWIADRAGTIVGFMAIKPGWVEHLYVHPGAQGEGTGSLLLARAKEVSPDRLELWTFQRNTRARAFYEKRGFHVVEVTDGAANEEREPDVRYSWRSDRR